MKWYRRGAELGFSEAQYNLGRMYDIGKVVPKNYIEASKWYRKAAEQGEILAQVRLGGMYKLGQGVPQDYIRAYSWLNISASQGEGNSSRYVHVAETAAEMRDELESRMPAEQIARAQELSATLLERIKQSR